jgi:hypothetical protein
MPATGSAFLRGLHEPAFDSIASSATAQLSPALLSMQALIPPGVGT